MGRPTTKEELISASLEAYEKLWKLIDSMTEKELTTPFDFSKDEKKKEAHWKRDKNVRDVLFHLHEWHRLTLEWIENNKNSDEAVPYLPEGYNWKTYGNMNQVFWEKCQDVSYDKAKEMFMDSHEKIMQTVESMTNEQLFTKGAFSWTGGNAIGSYFVSNTSSHYNWAMKKLRAHRKNLK